MRAKDAVGRYGESVAHRHLVEVGLTVLDRNWRCEAGELDIVAVDGRTLVVVEVKTRSSLAFGSPAEAVDHRKAARLRRLAAEWLAAHDGRYDDVRIDVVCVLRSPRGAASVEHLVGVV